MRFSSVAVIRTVKLGKGAYTAAGSTVTRDVPDYALAVERADLKVKEPSDSAILYNLAYNSRAAVAETD